MENDSTWVVLESIYDSVNALFAGTVGECEAYLQKIFDHLLAKHGVECVSFAHGEIFTDDAENCGDHYSIVGVVPFLFDDEV